MLKRFAGLAACAAAAFILVVNCVPSLASAASGVPVLGPVVRVVTLGRFEVKDDGYEASVEAPQIEGLLDDELEAELNQRFRENADAVILAFERDVKALKEEFGSETVHYGVTASYVVRTDNEAVLAIDTYIMNTVGSSSTKHIFYNIDKATGRIIELGSLFRDGADYVTPISEYILSEMARRNEAEGGMFWIGEQEEGFEGFEKIKPDQSFFINDEGDIVICFDKYEVAAGAQGCPEFVIPAGVIGDILK